MTRDRVFHLAVAAVVLLAGACGDAGTAPSLLEPEPTSPTTDSLALVAFYEATGGDTWTNNDNWLKAPLGEWHGVGVDGEGRVDSLHLSENGLTGIIPSELGNLANLEWLVLGYDSDIGAHNNLTGAIPSELGKLANLQILVLSHNKLTGTIPPELGSLANLGDLNLSHNSLSGTIPPELGDLTNLVTLRLHNNSLSGTIPPELGSLANLWLLDLGHNSLAGAIPPELGGLANLELLLVNHNNLTGTIPSELGELASLEMLSLSGNSRLSGSLPATFLGLGALRRLYFGSTNVCAPADLVFQGWLNALERYQGRTCAASRARP